MPIDYSKYPEDWLTRIRPDILKRADNKCEQCGAENYKPHPVTESKVILTVAHLDHDIKNNDYENLKALCQRDHLRHDAEHHVQTRQENKIKRLEEQGQTRLNIYRRKK